MSCIERDVRIASPELTSTHADIWGVIRKWRGWDS